MKNEIQRGSLFNPRHKEEDNMFGEVNFCSDTKERHRCNCRWRNCVTFTYFLCLLVCFFLGRTWFAWCKGYTRGTRTQRGPWTTWSPREYSRAPWDISSHKALALYFFLPSIETSHVNFSPVRFPVVHQCTHFSACVCVPVCSCVCLRVRLYDLLHLLSSCPFAWADYYVTSL